MPEDAGVVDPAAPVFGLSASQIGRRIDAAAKAAGLGEGFTGHSGRVGMAQDLAASGMELPELDDRRPVEIIEDAGEIHRAPGGGTGRGGQVLPGKEGLGAASQE